MIFVTGGTGLLGSHLLLELLKKGKQVRALKRPSSDLKLVRRVFSYYTDNPDDLLSRVEWINSDLMDFSTMEESLEDVHEIYHCGAVVSFYPKDHRDMLRVNIEGTANLINLALEKKIGKFLHVSSVSTLGRADNNGLTDEETYWKTSSKNSIYAVSKYGGEREVWRGMEEGLNAVIINPSVILGPGFWEDNSGLFPLVHKGLRYYPKGGNGYVDVEDAVRVMTLLMEQNIFNERFVVNAENVTYKQLFTWMAEHLDKPAPSVYVEPWLSNIAWRVEAAKTFFTGALPELTQEMATITSQEYTYSNDKIRKRLGFEFVPVKNSIEKICRIYLKEVVNW